MAHQKRNSTLIHSESRTRAALFRALGNLNIGLCFGFHDRTTGFNSESVSRGQLPGTRRRWLRGLTPLQRAHAPSIGRIRTRRSLCPMTRCKG
jgi:hypothetical protein